MRKSQNKSIYCIYCGARLRRDAIGQFCPTDNCQWNQGLPEGESSTITVKDRYRGCLLGLAIGDAVGTSVEFKPRGTFKPVTDMDGGGPFNLKPGEWTDDTSMALCLADSLIEKGGFSAKDQLERYVRWYDNGYMSSNGRCFDIGNTTRKALERFKKDKSLYADLNDEHALGNGSIMRLAPVPLFFYPSEKEIMISSAESSATTHAHVVCEDACALLGLIICRVLDGKSKDVALFGNIDHKPHGVLVSDDILHIAKGSYRNKLDSKIKGSGYVVESLEAALWCFWKTNSFKEAILKAVNLGDDADTTAAVCGQVAGAFYGESGMPKEWLDKLVMRGEIGIMAEKLIMGENDH